MEDLKILDFKSVVFLCIEKQLDRRSFLEVSTAPYQSGIVRLMGLRHVDVHLLGFKKKKKSHTLKKKTFRAFLLFTAVACTK